MQITILLQNRRGDELGVLELESVRLVTAGMETARPDLGDQMAQLIARLDSTLAGLGFAPLLDPLGVKIAVSRALLNAQACGVSIPLQVQALDGSATATGLQEHTYTLSVGAMSRTAVPATDKPTVDEWEGLFNLGTAERSPGQVISGNTGLPEKRAGQEPLDQWTTLGDMWEMDDEGGWT